MSTLDEQTRDVPTHKARSAGYQSRFHLSVQSPLPCGRGSVLPRTPQRAGSYFKAQVNSFQLSPGWALMPRAAEGSKPQCAMQCSQRESFPCP